MCSENMTSAAGAISVFGGADNLGCQRDQWYDQAERRVHQVDYSRLTDEELLEIIGDDPVIKTMSDAQLLAMINNPHNRRM
jgi:hypothetical protein